MGRLRIAVLPKPVERIRPRPRHAARDGYAPNTVKLKESQYTTERRGAVRIQRIEFKILDLILIGDRPEWILKRPRR